MEWVSTERVFVTESTDAMQGNIKWAPAKSLWYFAHLSLGIVGVVFYPTVTNFLVFVALSAMTICLGHSVGMHRLLIHRSFKTPIWVEHVLVWLGTLVGMSGPIGIFKIHELRDWHQAQKACPEHCAHTAPFFKDAWWQLHCDFHLTSPPELVIEREILDDRFYRFVDRTWRWQQLAIALPAFYFGGLGMVLWAVSLRIWISLTVHWTIVHFAHQDGQQNWHLEGLPVQGYNLTRFGLITFGESFHGNHHAFPHSAKLGEQSWYSDLGYSFIRVLETLGLAWDVTTPATHPHREGLRPVARFSKGDVS